MIRSLSTARFLRNPQESGDKTNLYLSFQTSEEHNRFSLFHERIEAYERKRLGELEPWQQDLEDENKSMRGSMSYYNSYPYCTFFGFN